MKIAYFTYERYWNGTNFEHKKDGVSGKVVVGLLGKLGFIKLEILQ